MIGYISGHSKIHRTFIERLGTSLTHITESIMPLWSIKFCMYTVQRPTKSLCPKGFQARTCSAAANPEDIHLPLIETEVSVVISFAILRNFHAETSGRSMPPETVKRRANCAQGQKVVATTTAIQKVCCRRSKPVVEGDGEIPMEELTRERGLRRFSFNQHSLCSARLQYLRDKKDTRAPGRTHTVP